MKCLNLAVGLGLWVCLGELHGASPVVISEFMASNSHTLADEDGSYNDWIEIHNTAVTNINLGGWYLTDSITKPTQWQFPATNLNAGSYMVVFASNKNRRVPGFPLHTNFKLGASGGYLGLVMPDGITVATEFNPAYPPQVPDVSFGFGELATNITLLPTGALARILVPTVTNGGSALNYSWIGSTNGDAFNDSGWAAGMTGIGFSSGTALVASTSMVLRLNFDAPPVNNGVADSKPGGTLHNAVNNNATWTDSSTDSGSRMRTGVMRFTASAASQITVPANADFNSPTGAVTFWMRSAGTTGGGSWGAMLLDRRTGNGDVIVQQDNGSIFTQPEAMYNASSTRLVSDDRWHHIAYVYDQSASGSVSVYIDGVLDYNRANPRAWSWPAAQELELGRSWDGYWRDYNGLMDDFRVYRRPLTVSEVGTIYAGDDGIPLADIGFNAQFNMMGVNASVFVRIPFVVSQPTNLSLLTLRMKYDDGYVAWINGVEVARALAPTNLAWNSKATASHTAATFETVQIGNPAAVLVPGTNILAIQGLNLNASNKTCLILPELTGMTVVAESAQPLYFTVPTPGQPNVGGTSVPGPGISEAQHVPGTPLATNSLVVTARVWPTFNPILGVTLFCRVMYDGEIASPMNDGGTNGDLVAGDGIWTGVVPAGMATDGQMIRYALLATDVNSNTTRWPLYTDPAGSAQYLGTVVNPNSVISTLPVFHLFIPPENQAGADSQTGSRCSFFYDGELYDNIEINLRGNTTAGYIKKSHHLNFNREHPFRPPGGSSRISHTSLLAEYIDPAYVRQFLSFWTMTQAGHPAPFHYPVHVRNNGQFYQLTMHDEVLGQDQLSRMGYDPNGALYKTCGVVSYPVCTTGGGLEKKTRLWEDNQDYIALANAVVNTLPLAQRRTNLCDMVDLPDVINYLAVSRLTHEQDDIWANLSLYRDSDGDQLWRIIPFDMNLSWGQLYGVSTVQATNDAAVSHPFYGASTVQVGGACSGFNHLFDAVVQIPETRQMFLRRLRSVMDAFLQPPGTPRPQLILEAQVAQLTNLIWAEAYLDRQKWGWAAGGPGALPAQWLPEGVSDLMDQFISPRRTHLYVTHSITNTAKPIGLAVANNAGIPLSQPGSVYISVCGLDYNPVSCNQAEEYICLTNPTPFALDISGWQLEGGVRFTFKSGTVMPTNSVLYVSPSLAAFRARKIGPRGGQALFVVGPYQGQLSARGETIRILNPWGQTVSTSAYPGNPSPAQQYLRITEIMYHPAAFPGDAFVPDEYEYIELKNISTSVALDLTGVAFTNGVFFTFTGSAVTNLGPGQSVLIVKNLTAFTARYGSGLNVAGQYAASLSHSGERIQLWDSCNEQILDFRYSAGWNPITDGLGFSLVVTSESVEPDAWGTSVQWRPSAQVNGSPGAGDSPPPAVAPILINELLSRSESPDVPEFIELYNPASSNANIGGWFLTDNFETPKKYRIPDGTVVSAGGYVVFDQTQYGVGLSAFGLDAAGEQAWLFSADPAGNLTGYVHGLQFGAVDDLVSFGRYITSDGRECFPAQTARTRGGANAGPRVSPVVFTEIMYHPPEQADGSDNTQDEFLELQNITSTNVTLFDAFLPTNTWHLRGGVSFDFPTNLTFLPGEFVLVVSFDPTNSAVMAAFRLKCHVADAVRILGPYVGKLNNSGDTLELKRPSLLHVTNVVHVLMDNVAYGDNTPWAAGADGYGLSLQRLAAASYGDDPSNWTAAPPSPGSSTFTGGAVPVLTQQPASQTVYVNSNVLLAASASGAGPILYQWRFHGTNIASASNATLLLRSIQPSQAGDYQVAAFTAAGSTVSSNAFLSVVYPVTILAQPQSVTTKAGSKVTFTVTAMGSSPIRCQWLLNGAVIPQATNTSLVLSNAQPSQGGIYSAVLSDAYSTVTSSNAVLSVLVDPAIILPPLSQAVVTNGSVTLSVAVTNTATLPVGYRWRRGNLFLANAYFTLNERTCFLVVSNVQSSTNYSVVVTNASNTGGVLSSAAYLTVLADSDSDGLPDAWMTQYLGHLTGQAGDHSLPADDYDGDGMKNLQEYVAGTNPTNALSLLKLVGSSNPASPAMIQFVGMSNHTYSVLFSDQLGTGAWTKLADLPARSSNATVTVADPAPSLTNRSYRVVVPRQP